MFNPDQADGDGDGIGDACDSVSDSCTAAVELCPGTVTGSTVGATNDGSSSCNDFPNLNHDVWYAYTPATDGTVTVDTCDTPSFNTSVSVHSGCPGTIENELVCDGTACSLTWGAVSFNAIAGQTYRIRLTGWSFHEGDFVLTLSGPPCVGSAAPTGAVPNGNDVPGTPLMIDKMGGGSATTDITLTWAESCVSGSDYEIYEGTIGSFHSHTPIFCTTGGATTKTFSSAPGSTYYLVAPTNGGREGSYGTSTAGERSVGDGSCLPQEIGACM